MSYLVLHIDVEFIVGTVCADNGTSYPITNDKDELLWLYFHNNPHQNSISFGKDNKPHFNNSEVNYYGRFFDYIEKEVESFTLRGIDYPVIELLKESGLLSIFCNAFHQYKLDDSDAIPTLITFSSSISDNAKQKTVDYLRKQKFQIDSYTIPIAELTCYHALNKKGLKVANGSIAVFMEASNSTLNLIKLSLSDNYFLKDGQTISYKGKGLDPRKRALVRFIVNEVNKSTGVLSSEDEKEDEIDRLEYKADDWLKRLDAQTRNMPFHIPSVSFSKAPNMRREVFVWKNDLDSDTGQYTQELRDIFEAFRNDHVKGEVAIVFLLGNCFQSDRVKSSFKLLVGSERLCLYANKDIQEVLAMYPKIDFKRYSSEEARIKAQAEAEKKKLAEQLAFEDNKRKEAEKEAKRQAENQEKENKRREAQLLFERAFQLEKEGKLEDAKVNAENALLSDRGNKEFKVFLQELDEKIKTLNDKNDLYKSFLNKGDKFLENNELEKALEEFELAQSVFDNAEIIRKIIEVKRLIKNKEKRKATIYQLLTEIQSLMSRDELLMAKEKIGEVLTIDKDNTKAKALLPEIEQSLKQQKKERQEKENREKGEKILLAADNLFNDDRWEEAKCQYEMALNFCPKDKRINDKIKQCNDKIKAKDDAFNDLIFEATVVEQKGDFKKALKYLESAAKIKPDHAETKKKIKIIRLNIEFESENTKKTPLKGDDFFLVHKLPKPDDSDFLNTKMYVKKIKNDDSFIKPQAPEKLFDDNVFFGLLDFNKKK